MVMVLDIPIFSGRLSEAVDLLLSHANNHTNKNRLISATGAHGLVLSKKEASFAALLKEFFLNLPDGMPTVWIGRMKGAKEMERCYGPGFFEDVMRRSAHGSLRHFLCGGKVGVAEDLRSACEKNFNNYNCVGTYAPPFRDMTEAEMVSLAQKITKSRPDIVWIGLSTPKQEYFAFRLAKYIDVRYIVTVGAAFDFHTGRLRQAPALAQQLGLEWLFRLLIEPRRLFKRYLVIVPLFLYYATLDLTKFFWNKRNTA